MADKPTFGNLNVRFDTDAGLEGAAVRDEDEPFRIAVLGDFSGRGNRRIIETGTSLAQRPVREVDRDNLEDEMMRMKVALAIAVAGDSAAQVRLEFSELDDFHPDRIYQRLDLFQSMRDMRERLANPATVREAALSLRKQDAPDQPTPGIETASPPSTPADSESPKGLLDQILGATQSSLSQQGPSDRADWDAVVRKIVEPYALPKQDPKQAEFVAEMDEAISRQMRELMHNADFQQLESAWRGLDFLTRRLETDARLKICLIDVSKAELEADLCGADDLASSAAHRLLVDRTVGTPGAAPWTLLLGHYTFAATVADAELLGRLSKIASTAGAALITGGHPSLVGCDNLASAPDADDWQSPPTAEVQSAWQAVRRLPEATSVAVILPQFLLRLPYGAETNAAESFPFEELGSIPPSHAEYLWGNPAWAAACMMGQAFSDRGWSFRPGMISQLDGLPLHVYKCDGEAQVTPPVEILLNNRAVERIAAHGLMTLRGVRDSDAIVLSSFNSLAEPSTGIKGRWNS